MSDINAIRDMVPGVLDTVYLNTGTCGPLPRVAHQAVLDEMAHDLTKARIDGGHFPHIRELRDEVRDLVSQVIGADKSEIAITSSTTDGMYAAISGYRWQRGDELILSNIEHPGGLLPSFLVKRRYGVRVRVADLGLGGGEPADVVEAFEKLVTPRTRMIVISHVSYTTGAKLPVKEIVEMAHSHDVLVAVDAAQSYGALHLNMHDLGVDFYAGSGQKWMCGPDGTGMFYVRAASTGDLEPVLGSGGMMMGSLDYFGGSYAPPLGAQRFDTAGRNTALLAGQAAATRWILEGVGVEWATKHITDLCHQTYDQLAELDGITMVTPREALAGLIAFNVKGIDAPDLSKRVAEESNVTIRFVNKYINNPDAARVSVGFYNTESDIEQLMDAIQKVQKTLD